MNQADNPDPNTNPNVVQLSGADTIRLVVALGRAEITPFTRSDWDGWSGATGEAHMVTFLPRDHRYFLQMLGAYHWYPEYVTVILDELGVSWNASSPHNSYAWQAQVQLVGGLRDVGAPEQYTEVDSRRGGDGNTPAMERVLQSADRSSLREVLEQEGYAIVPTASTVAVQLPPDLASTLQAAPPSARGYVLSGILGGGTGHVVLPGERL